MSYVFSEHVAVYHHKIPKEMSLFQLQVPEKRELPLNDREYDCVEKEFPRSQRPIHFAMRANIRYQKESRNACVAALSSHFICLFTQKKMGEPLELWAKIHISQIQMIAYREGDCLLLKTKETNVTFSGEMVTRFAQLVYRNYCLSYSLNNPDDVVELRTDNMKLFPDIRLQTSPSQRFQFAYFATCSLNNVKYNQDVVRYIHSLLLSGNSIVDVSLLPVDLFGSSHVSDYLFPIFNSLKLLRYVSGICLSNTERPDLVRAFVPVVSYCENMRIVHFENCGVTDGLEDLAHEVHKSENFSVSYWNLSKNKFTDFAAFPRIIDESTEPLLYMNLNDCGISAEDSASLFRSLRHFEKIESLKYFYYAGNDISGDEAISEFSGFLKVAKLETLDLSRYSSGAEEVLKCLNKYKQPLKNLMLVEGEFTPEAINQLLIFIKETQTLRELDVSAMNLSSESVAGIIHAIVMNKELRNMSLKLDRLDLHEANLFPIFRAFLDEEKLSKWKELSFNGNGLKYEDLKNLIPLFKRMRKLESLSLSGNFDSEMYGIGILLKDVLKVETLKRISVAGGNGHHLGDELQPFLRALSKHTELVYLDISHNAIGNHTIPYVIQILHDCHRLETLLIDDNAFDTTDKMEQLIEAVDDAKNLISFGFPVSDCVKMVASMDEDDEDAKNIVIARLAELQINAAKAINEHRLKKGLPGELPFDVKPEIMELIRSISRTTRKRMTDNREKMKVHSCVCEVFGLPLPFQKMGEVVTDGGPVVDVEIGEMAIYETECMGRVVKEVNANYPDFYHTTTMGPNLKSVLTGQMCPPFVKDMESVGNSKKRKERDDKKRSHRHRDDDSDSGDSDNGKRRSHKSRDDRDNDKRKSRKFEDSDNGKRKSRKYQDSSEDSDDNRKSRKHKYSSSDSDNDKRKSRKYQDSSEDSDHGKRRSHKSRDDSDNDKRKSRKYQDSSEDSDHDKRKSRKHKYSSEDSDSDKRKSRKYRDDREDYQRKSQKSHIRRTFAPSESDSSDDDKRHSKQQRRWKSKKATVSSDTESSDSFSDQKHSSKSRKSFKKKVSSTQRKNEGRVKWSNSVRARINEDDISPKAASCRSVEPKPKQSFTLETRHMSEDDNIDILMEISHRKHKESKRTQSEKKRQNSQKLFTESYKARLMNPSKFDAHSSDSSEEHNPKNKSPQQLPKSTSKNSDGYSSSSSPDNRQRPGANSANLSKRRSPKSQIDADVYSSSSSQDNPQRKIKSPAGDSKPRSPQKVRQSSSDSEGVRAHPKGKAAQISDYSDNEIPHNAERKRSVNAMFSSSSGEPSPRSKQDSDAGIFQVPQKRDARYQPYSKQMARRQNMSYSESSDSELAVVEKRLATGERLAVSSLSKPPHMQNKQAIIDYAQNVLLGEETTERKRPRNSSKH